MNVPWSQVPLGELLDEQKVRVGVFDADGLPLLGVSNTSGLHRTEKPRIADMSRYLRVDQDWFAYNPMRINVGSIGWAERSEQTGVISPDYVVFSCTHRIEPKLLYLFLRSAVGLRAINLETAGSVRERLYFDSLARIRFPLPPLPEQRRIVARIEELAAKINEARGLRRKAAEEVEALVSRATSTLIDGAMWSIRSLGDLLVESPRNGLSPKREVENGGRPMLRINAVSSSPTRFVDLTALKMVEVQDDEAAPFELRCDDVFIVRYNGDINRVAKAAIYKGSEPSRSIFPDKLMRLRPDHSKIIPDFLVYTLGSRRVRQQIEQFGKTTAGNIGISGSNAKSFQVPVPRIRDQHRIVEKLDDMQFNVDALKKLQAGTAAELAALLSSILDKAFKGEL